MTPGNTGNITLGTATLANQRVLTVSGANATIKAGILTPTGAINPVTVADQGGLDMLGQTGEYLVLSTQTLTPKPVARTSAIMAGLLSPMRYATVVYLTAPAARSVVLRAAASLPPGEQNQVAVRDLPATAFGPGA